MRICLISSSFYPATFYGGPISSTWDLSKKLTDQNIEVFVSTTNANGNKKLDILTNTFIKQHPNLFVKYYNEQILNKFSFQFILGIWSDIKRSDVVYIQYLFHYTVLFSLIFSVFQKKRIIICPRGCLSEWALYYKYNWIKRVYIALFVQPFSSKVIWQASSYLEEQDILREFPRGKVVVINDGVNFKSFQHASQINYVDLVEQFTGKHYDDISNLFFSMGRLHKIKGFDVLIDAFALLIQDNVNAKLLIAGADDGVKETLLSQIQSLNLSDSVFLIGSVNFEDKILLLSNCDVFVLASEFESFGIVVAEALACGTPVVVSNKTPWRDLEINNCGILANNEKISFYHSLKKIIEIRFDKVSIKNYIKSNYDWGIIVGRFLKLTKTK